MHIEYKKRMYIHAYIFIYSYTYIGKRMYLCISLPPVIYKYTAHTNPILISIQGRRAICPKVCSKYFYMNIWLIL